MPLALSLGVLALLASSLAAAEPNKEKAREHFDQAEMFMNTAVYDEAIKEYKLAYEFAPKAHGFLFNIGLAYEKWRKGEQALKYYSNYLEKAPKGKKASEARARKVALERKLEPAEKPPSLDIKAVEPPDSEPPEPIGIVTPAPAADSPAQADIKKWAFIGVGAAMIAGGVALDLGPSSSRNSSFDGVDVLPVALYAVGGTLMLVGIF